MARPTSRLRARRRPAALAVGALTLALTAVASPLSALSAGATTTAPGVTVTGRPTQAGRAAHHVAKRPGRSPVKPRHRATHKPVPRRHASGRYLALGDSVPFGYSPPEVTPPTAYADAATFVSYPQDVARALGLKLTNASCPGETTGSFLAVGAQSNGCENSLGGGAGYRTFAPLHTSYAGTQDAYAVGYLKAHPDTSLVTLMVGANDAFLCQEQTRDACAGELAPTLTAIAGGVSHILDTLRTKAHYTGALAVVTYYSTDYRDATTSQEVLGLDRAVTNSAAAHGAEVVDGYAAFQAAAARAGGDTCAAGLLIRLPDGTCNVHPTPAGHAVLAAAVERTVAGVVRRELARKA